MQVSRQSLPAVPPSVSSPRRSPTPPTPRAPRGCDPVKSFKSIHPEEQITSPSSQGGLRKDVEGALSRCFTVKSLNSSFFWRAPFFQNVGFPSLLKDIQDSLIYKYYSQCVIKDSLNDDALPSKKITVIGIGARMKEITEIFDRCIFNIINFTNHDVLRDSCQLEPYSLRASNLKNAIQDRLSDLPDSFNVLTKGSQVKSLATYPYLADKVGVHKLATLSSGVHSDYPKILGYIGFLNILFLHDDIKIDSLAPSVYTAKNKTLLSTLHALYMEVYDEVLNKENWIKEDSSVYKELMAHSAEVDTAFGQPFFLGDAVVRFAQDVRLLLALPDGDGKCAQMNIRQEVQHYFLACEEEFENKIQGSQVSFLKDTQESTINFYLEIRRRNGAVAPCFEYVFLMHGLNIDVQKLPLVDQWKKLRISYIDHICIVNDLQSFPKEATETSPHNLILILKIFHNDLMKGFAESTEYFEGLTEDISSRKKDYFDSLKTLLIQDVISTPIESLHITLDQLLNDIDKGVISIKSDQTLLEHIKNAYKSILLMEQWANGHVEWEYEMRGTRHATSA